MKKACNVIAFWAGDRANISYGDIVKEYNPLELIDFLYHTHATVDGGMDYDTIIVCNKCPNDKFNAEDYLKEFDGRETKNGKFIVEFRDNISISFGAFNHAYKNFDYDYFFFTEDDHIFNKDNWYKDFYDKFNSDKDIGFVAGLGIGDEYIGKHAHGGIGFTSKKVLDKIANIEWEDRDRRSTMAYADGTIHESKFRWTKPGDIPMFIFDGEEYLNWEMAGYITETAFTGYLEKLNDTCKTDYVIGLKIVDFPNNFIKWFEDYGPLLSDEDWKLIKNGVKSNMKPISFIQPSRNNLKYLKWSYNSIRKNLGYFHEICMADDFSNDGTWEWMQEIAKKDKNVKIHRNEGPTRLGHTILYDTLINDYATNDIVMIYHADMYAAPGLDKEVNKYIKPGVVVSMTRIEPPLHPDGPEKYLVDYGIEPEEFRETDFLSNLHWKTNDNPDYKIPTKRRQLPGYDEGNRTSNGIFAPWAIYKSDFQSIGGHDPLYAPQSKEDSDIFNRFKLNGYKFIQTFDGFVYHMTCRGSRFADGAKRNPDGQVFMKGRETDEWLAQNQRSTRNFIRKWGHMVSHDKYLHPIIAPKYDIGLVIKNCTFQLLFSLEPWCSTIYVDCPKNVYQEEEQKNTIIDLNKRIKSLDDEKKNDIIITFDGTKFKSEHEQFIINISNILKQSAEIGKMKYDIFEIDINSLETYEKELIKCES